MVCYSRLLLFFSGLIFSTVAYGQIPVAGNDDLAMYEDTPNTFNILANDFDLLAGINAASVDLDISTPAIDNFFASPDGTYSVNESGVLTFDPTLNFNGVTSHSYTVQNNGFLLLPPATSLPATITITVAALNDAPIITAQSTTLTTPEATALAIELSDLTIEDPDNVPSDFVLEVQDGTNYEHTGNSVTPNANFSGPLTVNVIVNDGVAPSNTFPLIVTVNAVNSAPVISGVVSPLSTPEDSPLTLVVGNFTISDADVGDTFTLAVQDGTGYTHVGNQITPNLNFNGPLSVGVVVNDGTVDSDVFLAPVTVTPVNDIPQITGQDVLSTPEATPFTILLTHMTITDPDSDPAGFTLLIQPGDYTLAGNTVTPLANFNGILDVPLVVNDGDNGNSGIFTLKLNVTGVNDEPTISAIGPQTTAESTATNPIAFTINDAETAAGDLTVSATSSVTTLVPNTGFLFGGSGANRNVIITPVNNQSGTTIITVTVSDGDETSTSAFELSVTSVNEAPTITPITPKSTNEDQVSAPIAFTVGDNDTAVGSLSVTGSSSDKTLVPDANLVFSGNGANRTVTITPAADQTGTTVITLQVSDGSLTQEITFSFSVTPVNDGPTISAIGAQTTTESTATPAIAFTVSDVDSDPNLLTVTGVSNNVPLVPNGNITLEGTGASRTVTITPVTGENGVALITLTVSDGSSTAQTSFQLTVSIFNDPPTVTLISEQTTTEDVPTSAIPFTIGDADTPVSSLTVTGTSSDKTLVPDANINFTGGDISRAVTITPAPNQNGTTTITITVSDGTSSNEIVFPLVVASQNDVPTITTIAAQNSTENVATSALPFTVADIDTDVMALTVSGSSSNKTLVPDDRITFAGSGAARTVTVTPAAGESGVTTITLNVSDGSLSASTSFIFTVTSVNDAPTITSISSQTIKEDTATPALAFTIGDAETPATSLIVTGSSSDKTIVPDANIIFGGAGASRTVTITPAPNQYGSVTITLTVSDLNSSKQMTFPLVISAENDAPVIIGHNTIITPEETPLTLTADHLIISDPDGDKNFKVTVHAGEDYGFTGAATVIPKTDFDGILTVNVSVSDGTLESARYPVIVTVSDVNIAPIILAQRDPNPIPIVENTSYELKIGSFDFRDPDNNPTDFKLLISEGTNYSLSGPEKTVITPLPNYNGPLDVMVMVTDGKNQSLPFAVKIVVVPESDDPGIIGQEVLVTNEDEALPLELGNFTITGTNSNSYSLTILDGENYSVDGLTITPDLNVNGILEVGVQVGSPIKMSTIFTAQVYVVPINDAPQIVTMETNALLYEPGSGPVSITENFHCEDIDSEFLNYAEVRILDSLYSPLNDELIFEPIEASPIRGVYDASRGVLTLIGYAPPAEYDVAIRSVKYNYRLTLDENGEQSQISTEPKAVSVELSDGQLPSDKHIRPIELETSVDLDIPNAFTPNGDLVNNTWAVRPVTNSDQFDKTIIRVYNRRGLLVYESVGFEKEWDGTFNGEVLPMDTYYYTIDLQLSFINKTYKGAVTILR